MLGSYYQSQSWITQELSGVSMNFAELILLMSFEMISPGRKVRRKSSAAPSVTPCDIF